MISENFFKEKLEVISSQKHVGFSARQLIFLFLFFFSLSPFLSYYHLFISFFLFLSEKVVRTRAHTTYSPLTEKKTRNGKSQ